MRYFDKTFFKFLFGLGLIIVCGLLFISKVQAQTALVDINTASSQELQNLNGIGPAKTQAIIDYRNQNGPFQKIEDIKNVSGIGDATYANIKDFIIVGSQSSNTNTVTTQTIQQTSQTTQTKSEGSSAVTNTLSVDGGKDKVGVIGQPLEFRGETNSDKASLVWVFGDGSTAYGKVVTHSYKYPGEYVVVFKASQSGLSDSSRINVKIVSDTLSITHASPDRIEITNNGKEEINLYGRALVSDEKNFIFPEDTIIKAGQKISFSNSITGLEPLNKNDASLAITGANSVGNNRIALSTPRDEELEKKKDEVIDQIVLLQNQLISLKNKDEKSTEVNDLATVVFSTNISTSTPTEKVLKTGWILTLKHFFGFK